jgi:hypothetical protein
VGTGALVAGFSLLQFGLTTKSTATDTTQLAVAQRSADNTANRGSARTPEGVSPADADVAGANAADLSTSTTVAPTTTTVAPTTTTTVAPTTTTVKPTTTTTRPKPATTTTTSAPPSNDTGVVGDDVWTKLAQCESGNRNDTGAPYYGYFQFSASTWTSLGGTGLPSDHTYDEQKAMAIKLQARSGWGQWPVCSKKIGAA